MNAEKAEGSVFHVFIFSLPVMISQACDSLMMLTDRYLLAQVNPISAAAAMSGGMTAFLFWVFGAGLLGFVNPLTAQYMGANAPDKAKKVLVQALIVSVILSVPLLLFSRSLGFYYFTFLRLPVEELPLAMAIFQLSSSAVSLFL
jgi:multidrug resistance protein, MATE family